MKGLKEEENGQRDLAMVHPRHADIAVGAGRLVVVGGVYVEDHRHDAQHPLCDIQYPTPEALGELLRHLKMGEHSGVNEMDFTR